MNKKDYSILPDDFDPYKEFEEFKARNMSNRPLTTDEKKVREAELLFNFCQEIGQKYGPVDWTKLSPGQKALVKSLVNMPELQLVQSAVNGDMLSIMLTLCLFKPDEYKFPSIADSLVLPDDDEDIPHH